MSNAVRRVKRAREVAKKIRAINIISQKWLEYMYRPDGLCAPELTTFRGICEEMQRGLAKFKIRHLNCYNNTIFQNYN
ncbi:hypothetical protein Glove_193g26 [Diversispora epigaea]|uniref:Uncharacterized protein n=1 Tax=Diversispora epigaea TaxID=1348612 RepID=A0A397IV21_9GLOM|nr:hypothetical protein Glove_193g26 [Diversispora epigaea]